MEPKDDKPRAGLLLEMAFGCERPHLCPRLNNAWNSSFFRRNFAFNHFQILQGNFQKRHLESDFEVCCVFLANCKLADMVIVDVCYYDCVWWSVRLSPRVRTNALCVKFWPPHRREERECSAVLFMSPARPHPYFVLKNPKHLALGSFSLDF